MTAQAPSALRLSDSQSAPIKPIAILAGMAVNLTEWYDFALYGVLVPTLATILFSLWEQETGDQPLK